MPHVITCPFPHPQITAYFTEHTFAYYLQRMMLTVERELSLHRLSMLSIAICVDGEWMTWVRYYSSSSELVDSGRRIARLPLLAQMLVTTTCGRWGLWWAGPLRRRRRLLFLVLSDSRRLRCNTSRSLWNYCKKLTILLTSSIFDFVSRRLADCPSPSTHSSNEFNLAKNGCFCLTASSRLNL